MSVVEKVFYGEYEQVEFDVQKGDELSQFVDEYKLYIDILIIVKSMLSKKIFGILFWVFFVIVFVLVGVFVVWRKLF